MGIDKSISIDHTISDIDDNIHHWWDSRIDPILSVDSGDNIKFCCRDATNGQLNEHSTADDVLSIVPEPIHPLTGPISIKGASPGDVLEIEIVDIQHHGIGFTYFYPHKKGLLPNDFVEPGLHIWELNETTGTFVNGIEIPLNPFPGIIGVAKNDDRKTTTVPPRNVGGNLDIKHLVEGSVLYLPIDVPGGMLSIGDCHAAQGDGEVCVTGIEAPMDVTVNVSIRKDMNLNSPQFESDMLTNNSNYNKMYVTTGIEESLLSASRMAIRNMIDYLETEKKLTRSEAYMLCSVAVDLKINQAVNLPKYTVSAYIPQSIFPN